MVGVFVPVVESAAACPEAAFVVPAPIVRMFPPGEMQKAWERHEVATCVCEDNFELLIGVGAREANPLHTKINRHDVRI